MIEFDNGRRISSVLISTAMGISGSGMFPYAMTPGYRSLARKVRDEEVTVVPKSSTFFDRRGNFILWDPRTWKYIQRFPEMSMLNSYGLTNQGIRKNSRRNAEASKKGFKIIPSFYPEFVKGLKMAIDETVLAIIFLRKRMGENFWAIEINASCPNSHEKISENMRQVLKLVEEIKKEFPWLRIIVKVSVIHPASFHKDLENAGVDVLHFFNTILFDLIFSDQVSPLADVGGGGLSGGVTFQFVYEKLQQVVDLTSIPKILGCGVTNTTRARKFFALGQPNKTSISFCTAFLSDNKEAAKILALN